MESTFRVAGVIPNMVAHPKIARKLHKNHRRLEDVLTCGEDIKKCVQIVMYKIAENFGKFEGWGSLLVIMLGNIFRV